MNLVIKTQILTWLKSGYKNKPETKNVISEPPLEHLGFLVSLTVNRYLYIIGIVYYKNTIHFKIMVKGHSLISVFRSNLISNYLPKPLESIYDHSMFAPLRKNVEYCVLLSWETSIYKNKIVTIQFQ